MITWQLPGGGPQPREGYDYSNADSIDNPISTYSWSESGSHDNVLEGLGHGESGSTFDSTTTIRETDHPRSTLFRTTSAGTTIRGASGTTSGSTYITGATGWTSSFLTSSTASSSWSTSSHSADNAGGDSFDDDFFIAPPTDTHTASEVTGSWGPGPTTTTTTETFDLTFSSWAVGSAGATRLTTTLFTDDTGATLSTVITDSSVDWHSTVSTATTRIRTVGTSGDHAPGRILCSTIGSAAGCAKLYTAGPIGGLSAWSEVWQPVDRVTLLPSVVTATTLIPSALPSKTIYGWNNVSNTRHDAPQPAGRMGVDSWTIRVPAPAFGYQPYSALEVDDPHYSTYHIAVAASVTDTDESTLREQGQFFFRGGGFGWEIIQLLTRHSDDHLFMEGPVTDMEDSLGWGGFGLVTGDNSYSFGVGVFAITGYASDGASFASRSTVTSYTTGTFERGVISVIVKESAYSTGGDYAGPDDLAVTEIACSARDLNA